MPELSDRRVIVFDFLGWGRSDKTQDYAYTFAGDAIAAVAANLGRLPELAAFPRPIRLIWGDKDPDLSGIAESLHDAVPNSELLILPDAYHNLQIDEPQ